MHPFNDNQMFVLAIVALSIVGVVCIGLLVVFALSILKRKNEQPQKIDKKPLSSSSQSKIIANSSISMSAGIALLVLATRFVPLDLNEDWYWAPIFLVIGIIAIAYAWTNWRKV